MSTPAEENLHAARRKYDIATAAWFKYRDLNEIVELDPMISEESDEIAKGRKYKCTSPAATMAMGVWQKRKSDLDHFAAARRRELGDTSCAICKDREARSAKEMGGRMPEPDSRLPPERDDEQEAPL